MFVFSWWVGLFNCLCVGVVVGVGGFCFVRWMWGVVGCRRSVGCSGGVCGCVGFCVVIVCCGVFMFNFHCGSGCVGVCWCIMCW